MAQAARLGSGGRMPAAPWRSFRAMTRYERLCTIFLARASATCRFAPPQTERSPTAEVALSRHRSAGLRETQVRWQVLERPPRLADVRARSPAFLRLRYNAALLRGARLCRATRCEARHCFRGAQRAANARIACR